jgi:hypothetical protein
LAHAGWRAPQQRSARRTPRSTHLQARVAGNHLELGHAELAVYCANLQGVRALRQLTRAANGATGQRVPCSARF